MKRLPALCIAVLAIGLCRSQQEEPILQYQRLLQKRPDSSLLHFRVGEILFHRKNYQEAAMEFAKALHGDLQPQWTIAFSHIGLGRIFDVTGQPDRAASEYEKVIRTGDNAHNAISYASSYRDNPVASEDLGLPSVSASLDEILPAPPAVIYLSAELSDEAGIAELEGVVLLESTGGPDATKEEWRVLHSPGLDLAGQAIESARRWRADAGTSTPARLTVRFLSSGKRSRWHLVSAAFSQPGSASRPRFLRASYPQRAGVSSSIAETARIAAAINRTPSIKLQFEIDALGVPRNIQSLGAPSLQWSYDAAAFIQHWRFTPAKENGAPISAVCVIELVWANQEGLDKYLNELAEANGFRRMQAASGGVALRP